jgi:hypothetical protein
MKYSVETASFYDPRLFAKEKIPSDAVTLTEAEYSALKKSLSEGKVITRAENGRPIGIKAVIPVSDLLFAAKEELRTMRRDMLDAVTGIGFRASVAGNTALAQEAAAVSQQLLDITEDAALNAAQTYDDMRAAGMAAYRRIADSVSPGLRSAFKELEK